MPDTVIRIDNLSKKYIICHQQENSSRYRYKALRDVISSQTKAFVLRLLQPSSKALPNPAYEEFWALKDVSFAVKQGEAIGIIGRNGAGKSTLLKILSRITEPTTGRIALQGRVASLLEVGTGFHPELTGRENIYLNGSVLGMSRIEIRKKFDEIVAFAEVEKFLDTPVKRYSSGMYVRLAFSVAAHLEPDILIVDEVLAVGDVNFQKKCLGKMQDVSYSEGRTVLFVSHNIDAIQRLCSRCILLEDGQIVTDGSTATAVQQYITRNAYQALPNQWIDVTAVKRRQSSQVARFTAVKYSSLNADVSFYPYPDGALEFALEIEANSSATVMGLAVNIYNQAGTLLVNADLFGLARVINLQPGTNIIKLRINELHLKPDIYVLGLWLAGDEPFDYVEHAFEIEVIELLSTGFGKYIIGPVTCEFEFL